MKPVKKANQKNLVINTEYYTDSALENLLERKVIFFFDENMDECYDWRKFSSLVDKDLRIFVEGQNSKITDIKVALDDYNSYTTVAVLESGEVIYVSLT